MAFAIEPHPDWDGEPSLTIPFQRMSMEGHVMDRFVAYIVGTTLDGKRYCRTVEATGHEMEDGSAVRRLGTVRERVLRDGPSLCVAFEDGGPLPSESEQLRIE